MNRQNKCGNTLAILIIKRDGTVKGQKEKEKKEKNCWIHPDSNQGSRAWKSSALQIYQNISHAITRKREMEFSNPTLQVKYEHDPGI